MVPADAGVAGGDWLAVAAAVPVGIVVASAALTVSGDVVIVLLWISWISAKRTGTFVRLRNRSLRYRKLGRA
jgi:hypothetical protein